MLTAKLFFGITEGVSRGKIGYMVRVYRPNEPFSVSWERHIIVVTKRISSGRLC